MGREQYTDQELNQLYRKAESHFKKIPGVIGVGFGLKETNGKLTDELSFRVYVAQKIALSDLPTEQKIPSSFKGIKTDVILSFNDDPLDCQDTTHYDPIVGGITITMDSLFIDGGTLGCLTTLNGTSTKDNVGLLSNRHVLTGALNRPIYHPFFNESGTSILDVKSSNEGVIANLHHIGTQSNTNFHYPEDLDPTAHPYYLDCALGKVTTSHSSCCPTNCGTKYNAIIQDLGPIRGVRRIQASDIDPVTPMIVRKRGRRTGLTQGRVVEANATYDTNNPKHGAILIAPIEDNCEGLRKFADHGDSGSVIMNAQDEVIGLLFSMPDVPASSPFFGYGITCHIHPVLDLLNTSIITTPLPNADQRKINIAAEKENRLKSLENLKNTFISTSEYNKKLYQIFERYRGEIVRLVNNVRPVTVTWHRYKGPVFVAQFVKNFNDPDYKVPLIINRVSLKELFMAMKLVLQEHGSERLKEVLDKYADTIINKTEDCADLETMLSRLSKNEHQTSYHGRND